MYGLFRVLVRGDGPQYGMMKRAHTSQTCALLGVSKEDGSGCVCIGMILGSGLRA